MTPIINIILSIINKKNVIQQNNTVETNNWNNVESGVKHHNPSPVDTKEKNSEIFAISCIFWLGILNLTLFISFFTRDVSKVYESDYIMCFIGQKEGYFRNIRLTINNQPLIFLYYNTLFHRVSNQLKRSKIKTNIKTTHRVVSN
jgi:hypothetical protein